MADVLFIVLIADAAQNGMAGEYRSLADAAVLLGTLAACNLALDWATYRWPAMQRLMEPPTGRARPRRQDPPAQPAPRMGDGGRAMGKLREQGIADVADVKLAMLEADGELSVLKADGSAQPTDPAKHATAASTSASASERATHRSRGDAQGARNMLFLINLDDAHARRTSMHAQLAELGLAYERIGIDFRRAPRADIDAWIAQRFSGIAFDHRQRLGRGDRLLGVASVRLAGAGVERRRRMHGARGRSACSIRALPEAIDDAGARRPRSTSCSSARRRATCRRAAASPAGRFRLHRPLGTIYNTWGYVVSRAWVRRFFAAAPWRIDRPIDHYTGGSRAGRVKPRIAVLRPAVVQRGSKRSASIRRSSRTRIASTARGSSKLARRRIIASRVSALYYKLYDYL